jgi:hypothetical protein
MQECKTREPVAGIHDTVHNKFHEKPYSHCVVIRCVQRVNTSKERKLCQVGCSKASDEHVQRIMTKGIFIISLRNFEHSSRWYYIV